jgi:hypothetical protein
MTYKYCAVAMGKGVSDFKEMVEFAAADEYKIGLMAGDSLLVVTFISTFSKFEVYNILEGVAEINFVLTEVDDNSVKFQTHNMYNKLMGIFKDIQEDVVEVESMVGDDFEEKPMELMEEGYRDIVDNMTPREKEEKINEILDRMPDITTDDRIFLSMLSGE